MGERYTTGKIGSMRLLSSEQTYKSIAGGLDPLARKILALISALVLVTGVFVFFGGEAQAQQPEPQHAASYEIAVEQTTEATLFETSRTEKSPIETSPVETPPAGGLSHRPSSPGRYIGKIPSPRPSPKPRCMFTTPRPARSL